MPKHSWRVCVETWRADPRVQQKLADSTKAQYRRVMDAILEKNADKAMQHTTRQAVKAAVGRLAGTPRKAARYAQVVSLLWNYAANELDWPLGPNPAKKLGAYKARRGYAPWPDWMVKKLEDAPETVRTAARLILGTGQRPSAAISMRRDQFRGEWMVVRDEKAGQDLEVYCPPSLRAYVDALPVHGQHVLAKTLTTPLTYLRSKACSGPGGHGSAIVRSPTRSTACASSRSSSLRKPAPATRKSKPSPGRAPRWSPTTGRRQIGSSCPRPPRHAETEHEQNVMCEWHV